MRDDMVRDLDDENSDDVNSNDADAFTGADEAFDPDLEYGLAAPDDMHAPDDDASDHPEQRVGDYVSAQWTPPPGSGISAVDEAVAQLTALDTMPTAEHVAVYDAAHRSLQDALADLDTA